MTGVELIAAERQRGIEKEGFDSAHDDRHDRFQLSMAAEAYIQAALEQARAQNPDQERIRRFYWPWEREWWKPKAEPIGNLIVAGALIAAEIDRLQRRKEAR